MGRNYRVEGNLDHNQVTYKTGDIVNLEDQHAEPLLAIGRIVSAEDQPQPSAPLQPDAASAQIAAEKPAQNEQPQVEQNQTTVQPPLQPQQPQSGQPSPEEIARTAAEIQ